MKNCLVAIAFALSAFASAQKTVHVPAAITAIYDIQMSDFAKGDWDHFFSYYDPKFVSIDSKGKKSSLSAMRTGLMADMKGTTHRRITIDYMGCRATPTMVEVSYVCLSTATLGKRTAKLKEIGTDTWMKKGAVWKETKTVDKFFGPVK